MVMELVKYCALNFIAALKEVAFLNLESAQSSKDALEISIV